MLKKLKEIFKKKPINIYKLMGEERGLKILVDTFYQSMEQDPKAKECLDTHELNEDGSVPEVVKEKLFKFLSGWFGGPNLFTEEFGHPRMRARHIKFKITESAREQWIYCMEIALNQQRAKANIRINHSQKKLILNSFIALSMRIKNS